MLHNASRKHAYSKNLCKTAIFEIAVERWLSYKGTCHVILLAKLHDMYLYKTDNFFHINHYLKSQRWLSYTGFTVYNFDPLKPHFYIVKLGFTGVYIIFLIFARKHRLWVLVRTVCFEQKFKKIP